MCIYGCCRACGGTIVCNAFDIDPFTGVRGVWTHDEPTSFVHDAVPTERR